MKKPRKDPWSHHVRVVDVAGDGSGPWKLFVNGFGVACWSATAEPNPKAYAREVARVLRRAIRS
jgi:hypothetical protein